MTLQRGARKKRILPDAVLFDFDGVISDTEPLHWRAFCETLRPLGRDFSWREYAERYLGFDDRGVFRECFKQQRASLPSRLLRRLLKEKAKAFEQVVKGASIAPFPGVVSLIREIRREGIPLALCTGALRRDIRPLLERFELKRSFDVVVTADDVSESKPDPRAYRLALQRLRKKFPQRVIRAYCCVAIEDTPAGIQAAQGAGVKVLAVANTYPRRLLRRASWIVKSLESVALQDIVERVLKKKETRRKVYGEHRYEQ